MFQTTNQVTFIPPSSHAMENRPARPSDVSVASPFVMRNTACDREEVLSPGRYKTPRRRRNRTTIIESNTLC